MADNLDGASLITEERHRQRLVEGYYDLRDEAYTTGQLCQAAASYMYLHANTYDHDTAHHDWAIRNWPWNIETFRPADSQIRALTKAGALIAAEIDRLLAHQAAGEDSPEN